MREGRRGGEGGMGRGMRGRFRREGIYVYLWLIHVEVWQKTAKFCKAISLQLKINFKKWETKKKKRKKKKKGSHSTSNSPNLRREWRSQRSTSLRETWAGVLTLRLVSLVMLDYWSWVMAERQVYEWSHGFFPFRNDDSVVRQPFTRQCKPSWICFVY